MKQTGIFFGILVLFILSCEKEENSIPKERNSYIVVGDTAGCYYFDYNPDIAFNSESDSFDFNYDGKFDLEFIQNDVFINCVIDSCPPGATCDCWPTIYTDYIINVANKLEIAIDKDSTLTEFIINDTISNSNTWTNHTKYPMYHRTPYDTNWKGFYEFILGLRKIQYSDTLYSWISIRIENSVIIVKELAIQK